MCAHDAEQSLHGRLPAAYRLRAHENKGENEDASPCGTGVFFSPSRWGATTSAPLSLDKRNPPRRFFDCAFIIGVRWRPLKGRMSRLHREPVFALGSSGGFGLPAIE